MENNNRKRGRPLKYVTLESFNELKDKFNKFLTNDFVHARIEIRVVTILVSILLTLWLTGRLSAP